MILYLLVPVLILGKVESQTANVTESNQTSIYSTVKPGDETSRLYKDEQSLIEDELQSNQTSTFITEDDESFQDQEDEFPGRHCQEDQLEVYSRLICAADFHTEMTSISAEEWCVLGNIIGAYNDMTLCLEQLSDLVGCYYPNPVIQDAFLSIHSHYFHNCSAEALALVDAPRGLVVALTLLPVSLIPVLVYLVVWKSSVPE